MGHLPRAAPAAREGSVIKVNKHGQPGSSEPGDLYIKLKVRPHPVFTVSGDDIAAAHARLDDLQGHLAAHRLLLLGEYYKGHSPNGQFFDNAIEF